jgi:peptidoglycan hydrolase-like protein with peptidoglycan-binding domain
MIFGLLVLIVALTISGVAIYYSVAGLMAIFAASAIPIMIMGGSLEIGKLVAAVWLHKYWDKAGLLLKTYLSVAVVVLMLITSMGIFGFLSKAHIEQTANANENAAQIERIATDIAHQQDIIARAEQKITATENKGVNQDDKIQEQIDTEQKRIDTAYTRIQPSIDEQNNIIATEGSRLSGGLAMYEEQVKTIDAQLASLQSYIDANDIKSLQSLIGVKADGSFGPATKTAVDAFKQNISAEKIKLTQLIADEKVKQTSPVIDAAREEIKRLRGIAEQQIADSNALITRLRAQLGTEDKTATDQTVKDETAKITEANATIDKLTEQKYTLETSYRKLEAEVGPVKYLADFIYGDQAGTNVLEQAVRWVIVTIIFVFDPLAVVLLIASQYTFEWNRKPVEDTPKPLPQPVPQPQYPVVKKPGRKPKFQKMELHSDIAYPDTMPPTQTELEEMLKRADPETLEEVMKELSVNKEEIVDIVADKPYNDTVAEKAYGLDGKLIRTIKSVTIKNKE